jgi:hypothetical protein
MSSSVGFFDRVACWNERIRSYKSVLFPVFIEYNYEMIKQQLQADQIAAMKAKDVEKLQTLRYILAQIKNIEIDKHQDLTEEETIQVMRKEIKKLDDSITSFEKASRSDLAQEYKFQKDILAAYLPSQMSDEDLNAAVKKIVEANAELFAKTPHALIGMCVKELKDKAESSRIAASVQALQSHSA